MLGFLHADGHLGGELLGRGRLGVELNVRDIALLREFQKLTPWYSSISERHRDTNMKRGAHSATWRVSAAECRQRLAAAGMPVGAKSKTIKPPNGAFCEVDYFRGFLDGDGSVGTTATGLPFLSFGTGSPLMAAAVERFIASRTGKRKTVRANKREGFFCLSLFKEDAQALMRELYYPGALALQRKVTAVAEALIWSRPASMRKVAPQREWCDEEDDIIRNSTLAGARAAISHHSDSSIANRRFRLNKSDHKRSQVAPTNCPSIVWRDSPALLAFLAGCQARHAEAGLKG
jgi:hypothetical protein